MKNSKSEDLEEKAIQRVHNWASELTTETSKVKGRFYETKEFKSLCFSIKKTRAGLLGITGLQGTGKSRLLHELNEAFPNSFLLKWTRNWQKVMLEWDIVYSDYIDCVEREAKQNLKEFSSARIRHPVLKKIPDMNDLENFSRLGFSVIEKITGKGRCNQIAKEVILRAFRRIPLLLIDMPDYNKSNVGLMNKDVDELQALWNLIATQDIHIVVAIQKELMQKHPHFFWGKFLMTTLEPLSVDELVEAYKFITGDNAVFTDDALRLFAQLSRGVFRRFKKYIYLTIQHNFTEKLPLTVEHVNQVVTEKVLFEDMELELCDIFRGKEKQLQAVSVLNFLRNNSNVNIKIIAENIDLSEFVVQKLIQKLYLYRYVVVKRGAGKERLVSLQL